jgi:cysteine synthase
LALIGNTPCVPLHFQPEGLRVWAKCEFLNPSGSVKDRFAARVVATGSGAAAATKMP